MPPRPSTQSVDEFSAEAALDREIAKMGSWFAARGLDPENGISSSYEGARDRLCWRCGYFVGLKRALALLTSRDATLH